MWSKKLMKTELVDPGMPFFGSQVRDPNFWGIPNDDINKKWCNFFCSSIFVQARFGTRLTCREGRIFYQISGLYLHLREHRWLGFPDAVLRLLKDLSSSWVSLIRWSDDTSPSWSKDSGLFLEGSHRRPLYTPIQVNWSDVFYLRLVKNIRNSLKLMGCTIPSGSKWKSLSSNPFSPQVDCLVAKNRHLLENSLESSCCLKGNCSFDESIFKILGRYSVELLMPFHVPFHMKAPLCAGLFCGLQCCLRLLEGYHGWRME